MVKTGQLVVIGLFLLRFAATVDAHPAHAKPVKYPFVVGFERFYTNLDTPDHLARGGLVLLNELNCVACHKPPAQLENTLTGRPGTRLAGVGDRFEHLDLEMMIRNPRFVKTDTIMPSMFSGPDRDLDEIDSLKHFLATLKEPLPQFPEGDLDEGKILYHKIGCVSCHAPEIDYRPPWIPKNVEIELTALPSVPMNLADRYPREALIDLILDPVKHRPAGRMPRFDLTEKEAVDIGSYLNSTPKPELPMQLMRALAKAQPFHTDPEKATAGEKLFARKNCVACHDGVVDAEPILSHPLVDLKWEQAGGCLSARPPGRGVPSYGLDELQKKAIIEALKRIDKTRNDTAEKKVDWILSSRNCYSCHERNSKGGPESARAMFFTVNNPDALANGRWALYPPVLDGVGEKLTDQWWKRILYHEGGSGSVRDYMAIRMPVYRPGDLGELELLIKQLDQKPVQPLPQGSAANGCQLVAFDQKNCVSCHGIGDRSPPGVPAMSLDQTRARLLPGYFFRLLKNPQEVLAEVPMPNSNLTDSDVADIWAWLGEHEKHPYPDGLLQPETTELVPEDRPLVIRTSIDGLSEDALAIGFPGGVNFAFDIEKCELAAKWTGRFFDRVSLSRLGKPDSDWQTLPVGKPYKGYRIEGDRVSILCGAGEMVVDASGGHKLVEKK
ncbi:MAG: hypothetical protein P1V20_17120 [Verrucomicrobiales bacterium]|nr:hypothetical protein [Verrucomicrobiales bacterium]